MHSKSKPWTPEQDEALRKGIIAGASRIDNARERKAVENLVMQYRVERAAKWMGKFAIVVLALVAVAAVASIFRTRQRSRSLRPTHDRQEVTRNTAHAGR